MRTRTFVVYPESRFLLGTSCDWAHEQADLRLDLRVRIDADCDIRFTFYDPHALRLLASAANTLCANHRRCESSLLTADDLRPRSRFQPPRVPSPLAIWDRVP